MKKTTKKQTKTITSIFITFIILTTFVNPITGTNNINIKNTENQEKTLQGDITVNFFPEYKGTISPTINITNNQTIKINTTQKTNEINTVNHILKIKINIIGNTSGEYIFKRYLFALLIIETENNQIIKNFEKINILSEEEKYLTIPLNYETNKDSEKATMHIFTLGIPFRLSIDKHPGFAYNIIDINFEYNNTKIIDSAPPVTICNIQEEV